MSEMMESLREHLERERARLQKEIGQQAIVGEEHTGYGNHMADDATDVFEQAKSLALRRNLERLLEQVDEALEQIRHGTYGLCKRCGEMIDPARLKAMPSATLCLNCRQLQETRLVT